MSRRTDGPYNLAVVHPDLAAEWHPTRNGTLRADGIAPRSNRRVWWRCPAGHEWEAIIDNRSRGKGCPYCSGRLPTAETSLAALYPDLAAEWHPTRNPRGVDPRTVTAANHRRIWWRCPAGHEWEATVASRSRLGACCPYCVGQRATPERNLAVLYPEIAAEWHPTLNGALVADDVAPESNRRVWWRCATGHEWEAKVHNRVTGGTGCPYCAGKRATPERNLAVLYPEIAAEWHPTLNGDALPTEVLPGSSRRGWWRCRHGHVWAARVLDRTKRRTGCPQCAERGPKGVPLAEAAPELLDEWDRVLNSGSGETVMAGSNAKAWWRCRVDPTHRWRARIESRTRGTGCPFCAGQRPTPQRNLAVIHPDVAAQWHPTRNGDLSPTEVLPHSGLHRWWRCPDGHDWTAVVSSRTKSGTGCPTCAAIAQVLDPWMRRHRIPIP
jgi:hypothetical protein